MKVFLSGLALLLPFVPTCLSPSQVFAEDAHIVIRKTAPAVDDLSAEAPGSHTVRPGETLGGILLGEGFAPGDIPEALTEVLRLNPSLKDPRFIYPGQELVIPGPGVAGAAPGSAGERTGEGPYGNVPFDPDIGTLSAARRLRPLLDGTFRQLGESFSTSGTIHLPLGELGTIDIAGSSYPFVEFSTGRSVILDADGTLPPEWTSEIPGSWPSYGVVSPGSDSDIRTLLGEMFSLSGYHSVIAAEPFTIGREASVTLLPDFLILKTPRSLVEDEVYLVNVEDTPHPALPEEIRGLAADHRIRIVEVVPTADDYTAVPQGAYTRNYHLKVTSSDRRLIFRELAERIGLTTIDSLALPLSGVNGGLTFTPGRSLVLSHGSRSCMLYFGSEKASLAGLSAGGFRPVFAGANVPLLSALHQLLEVLDLEFSGPVIEFYRSRDRHRVTVPGLYLQTSTGPLFITDRNVGDHLFSYLAGTGMEVVLLDLTTD